MSSNTQIEANRRNALLSTGPRTPQGKAIVARNPLKHGLLSRETVLPSENRAEFEAFRARLLADLDPVGELEELLADRIVAAAWRLRRAVRAETLVLTHINYGRSPRTDRQEAESYSHYLSVAADNLRRYETTIERGFYKSLHELQRLQAARQCGSVPAPVAIDVTVSGPGEAA